ncbi:MAG: MFS transporter [Dehalococcoidia bacterium]
MQQRPLALRRAGIPRFVWARSTYLGWWVVGAVALVSFSRVAFFNPVLGIFVEPLQDEFGWSRATIAGALTVGTLMGAAASPFIGPMVDRYGGRRFMVGGVAVAGILLILLAFMEEIWQFYLLFGIGRAIVVSILDIAIVVTVANWFVRNRGRATGVMHVGTRGGMALMPLIVLLFLSTADWRAAFAALGVIALVIAIVPPWLLVRRRPEDLGLHPDGDRPLARTAAQSPAAREHRWQVRDAVRTQAFWLLLVGTSQIFLVNGAINLSIASHLRDNGISQSTAITVITVWALMGLIGGMLGGELRQRLSIRFALPMVLVLVAGGIVWLTFVNSVWMAYLFAVWHGLAFGAQLPLNQIAFPDYFGRWTVGALRGVTAPVQFGLNAVGPLLAALVFDSRGSFDLIFLVFAGLLVFGAALILLAAPPSRPTGDAASKVTRSRP